MNINKNSIQTVLDMVLNPKNGHQGNINITPLQLQQLFESNEINKLQQPQGRNFDQLQQQQQKLSNNNIIISPQQQYANQCPPTILEKQSNEKNSQQFMSIQQNQGFKLCQQQRAENQQTLKKIKLNVLLIEQKTSEKELISNIECPLKLPLYEISLSFLIGTLKSMGFPLSNTMISYFDEKLGVFVYCGNEPIRSDVFVPLIENQSSLQIKYREKITQQIDKQCLGEIPQTSEQVKNDNIFKQAQDMNQFIQQRELKVEKQVDVNQPPSQSSIDVCQKRIKERSIADVLDKVERWRNISKEQQNQGKKITLQQAATYIGVAKKTLDDYYNQIKLGKKYNFDFVFHKNDNIGILRAFVKKNKNKESSKLDKDSNNESESINKNYQSETDACDIEKHQAQNNKSDIEIEQTGNNIKIAIEQ